MKKVFLGIMAVALVATACHKSEVKTPYVAGENPVRFTTNLNYYTVKAAVEENVLTDVKVIAGAPINKVVSGTPDGKTMTVSPTLYWGAGQKEATTFVAITGGQTNAVVEEYNVLSGAYDYAYCAKLMSAAATVEPEKTVELNFKHIFSKLVINIDNQLGADKVASVSVGKIATVGKVDFEKAQVTITGEATSACPAFEETANEKYLLALLPQKAAPEITVTTQLGATYTFVMDAEKPFDFQGAKVATVALVLKGGSYTGGGLNAVGDMSIDVTDWAADATEVAGEGSTTLGDNYWYIEGTVNDKTWGTAFPMTLTAENVWEADFTYQAGAEGEGFKLHQTTGWDSKQVGYDPNPEEDKVVKADGETWFYVWPNSEYNGNIKLPAAGAYHITVDFSKGNDGMFMISAKAE